MVGGHACRSPGTGVRGVALADFCLARRTLRLRLAHLDGEWQDARRRRGRAVAAPRRLLRRRPSRAANASAMHHSLRARRRPLLLRRTAAGHQRGQEAVGAGRRGGARLGARRERLPHPSRGAEAARRTARLLPRRRAPVRPPERTHAAPPRPARYCCSEELTASSPLPPAHDPHLRYFCICLLVACASSPSPPTLDMDPQHGVFGWMQLSAGRLGCQVWITVAADLVGNLGTVLCGKQGQYGRPARTYLPIYCPRLAEAGGRPELDLALVGRAGGRIG